MRNRNPEIGGFVPFSSIDWPGLLTAVVFIKGCPWRCHYCHNPHLQSRANSRVIEIASQQEQFSLAWSQILEFLCTRKNLLDGVVFSGGEPFSEPALPAMIQDVADLGFKVAVHTGGMYPKKLENVLNTLTWVGLDIKTNSAGYDALTGRVKSAEPVDQSLEALLNGKISFECRTTWSPDWLEESDLIDLAQGLSLKGVRKYAVQRHRSIPNRAAAFELSAHGIQIMRGLFEQFSYR